MIKGLYTDEAWIAYTSSGANNKLMDDKTARKDLAKTRHALSLQPPLTRSQSKTHLSLHFSR